MWQIYAATDAAVLGEKRADPKEAALALSRSCPEGARYVLERKTVVKEREVPFLCKYAKEWSEEQDLLYKQGLASGEWVKTAPPTQGVRQ